MTSFLYRALRFIAWVLALYLVLVGLMYATLRAFAHDVYKDLRSPQNGQLCCGGDPVTGDCEPVGYTMLPNGDALISSGRYKAAVRVARDKITWLPVPGDEAHEAHWCGVPRSKVYLAPTNTDNPDPDYWTYCAFIAPGGV